MLPLINDMDEKNKTNAKKSKVKKMQEHIYKNVKESKNEKAHASFLILHKLNA